MDKLIISTYNKDWPTQYEIEKAKIMAILDHNEVVGIEHFGSTSVPGLSAKPIIDIIVGLRSFSTAHSFIPKLTELNYEYIESLSVLDGRLFLKKTPRTHHVHLVEYGTEHWSKPLIFRDRLKGNESYRKEYERLKLELAEKHKTMGPHYTNAKTDFIVNVLKE